MVAIARSAATGSAASRSITGTRSVPGDPAEHARFGAQHRDIGQAGPAQRQRYRGTAVPQTILAGSCTATARRHGASATDSVWSRPTARMVSVSRIAPA